MTCAGLKSACRHRKSHLPRHGPTLPKGHLRTTIETHDRLHSANGGNEPPSEITYLCVLTGTAPADIVLPDNNIFDDGFVRHIAWGGQHTWIQRGNLMAGTGITEIGGARHSFPTTDWVLIDRIKTHKYDDRTLIDRLLKRYWKPVYCYLRRRGYRNEEAKDLTQGFFYAVVLNHHFVERADPSKGRFRSFLLHALKQYLLNEKAKQAARMRIPGCRLIPLETIDPETLPASLLRSSPTGSYYYAWVSSLLDDVLADVKQACCAAGLGTHWEVFNARIVRPILDNTKPPPLKKLCKQFSIPTCGKASNMTITVKRRFRATLREHLSEIAGSNGNVDAEIDTLIGFLPRAAQDNH